MKNIRINFSTVKLITVLPLVILISCNQEAALPKVASINLLIYKVTSVYYSPVKRPVNFAFPIPDSLSFLNTALYRNRVEQNTYEYDGQKRITKYQLIDLEHPTDTYVSGNEIRTYRYDAQTVIPHSNRYPVTPIALNSEGYIAGGYTYDKNGHRVKEEFAQGDKWENIVVNDNITQNVATNSSIGLTDQTIYEYDLMKPNLPDPFKNLYGKPSHNLPLKETRQFIWADGHTSKTVTTYTYEYDQRGLPKRRTSYIEDGSPTDWNTKSTWKQVIITDFEFAQ